MEGNQSIFQAGDKLPATATYYVERAADGALLDAVRSGRFAYVLTSRQTGKSSLLQRLAHRLRNLQNQESSWSVATIALSEILDRPAAEPEHLALLGLLCQQFDLDLEPREWWRTQGKLSAAERIQRFCEEVLLGQLPGYVVLLIDEIECLVGRPLAAQLCSAIRACYDAQPSKPDLRRLGFVIAGNASPADLIRKTFHSPFPIGLEIELPDFTTEQIEELTSALTDAPDRQRRLAQQLAFWTRGHPYLVQKLCLLLKTRDTRLTTEQIDQVIFETFLDPDVRSTEEPHMRTLHERYTAKRAPRRLKRRSRNVLLALRELQAGRMLRVEDLTETVNNELHLWGVALPEIHQEPTEEDEELEERDAEEEGRYFIRNPIYDHNFDSRWVRRHLPVSGAAKIIGAVTLLLLVVSVTYFEWIYPRQLLADLRKANPESLDIGEWKAKFTELRSVPFYQSAANRAWVELAERRARQAILNDAAENNAQAFQLALSARGQIEQLDNGEGQEIWEEESLASLAEFYDQRARREMETEGRRQAAVLWALRALRTQRTVDRQERLLNYAAPFLPLEQTFRFEFGAQQLKWTADDQPVVLGTSGASVCVNKILDQRLDVLLTPDDVRLLTANEEGDRVASVSGLKYLRLWNTDSPGPPRALATQGREVTQLALSEDGHYLLTVIEQRGVQVWDLNSDGLPQSVVLSDKPVRNLAFAPGGQRVAAMTSDGALKMWNLATGELSWAREAALTSETSRVSFDPQGRFLLCQSRSLPSTQIPSSQILRVEDGERLLSLPWYAAEFDRSGDRLIGILSEVDLSDSDPDSTTSAPDTVLVVHQVTEDGVLDAESSLELKPATSWSAEELTSMELSFGPGSRLAIATRSQVQVIDLTSGRIVMTVVRDLDEEWYESPSASFDSTGAKLAVLVDRQTVQLWNTGLDAASEPEELSVSDWERKFALRIEPDGSLAPVGEQ